METSTRNILQLGVGLALVFFAFSSQSFIEESVLDSRHKTDSRIAKKAGYYSQTVIYGSFVFSNLFAPPVVQFLGVKWSLVIGSGAYTLFMAGFLYINNYYLYAMSAIEVLWTAVGHYLAMNSDEGSVARNSSIVWIIYMSSLIFGGVFLFVVFGNREDNTSKMDISMSTTRICYGSFTGVSLAGNFVFALLPQADKEKNSQSESKDYLKELLATFRMLFTRDILLLSFIFAFSGMELAYWSGVYSTALSFTKRFPMNTHKLMALNAMCTGVGQLTAGVLFGLFGSRTNRIGRWTIVLLGALVSLVAYALSYINLPADSTYGETHGTSVISPNVPVALFVGFLLGFADASVNTQIYSLLSILYKSKTTQAFAISKFHHAVLTTICFYYSGELRLIWQLVLLSAGAALATLGFAVVERDWMKRRENSTQKVSWS